MGIGMPVDILRGALTPLVESPYTGKISSGVLDFGKHGQIRAIFRFINYRMNAFSP
jgi:hypothetical protein